MAIDPLSSVLQAVRLTGAAFFDVAAAAPWVAEAPHAGTIAHDVLPGAQHVIPYHVVTQGGCVASLVDGAPLHLEAGDVIVFPQGDPHVLASAPGMRAAPPLALYREVRASALPAPIVLNASGGPETAHLVCGFLGCDARPFNPLLATLPPVLRVNERDAPGGLLTRFIELARAESAAARAGAECVLGKLSELMFVEVVRRHLQGLPEGRTGWLAGLRDPHVGRALSALHARPAHPWTLDDLGREAGLSRSALAERFSALVGEPPMQYLARWRMQVAAGLLASTHDGVAAVAAAVGYASEAAFNRAFRKLVGVPPATWRRGQRAAPAPPVTNPPPATPSSKPHRSTSPRSP